MTFVLVIIANIGEAVANDMPSRRLNRTTSRNCIDYQSRASRVVVRYLIVLAYVNRVVPSRIAHAYHVSTGACDNRRVYALVATTLAVLFIIGPAAAIAAYYRSWRLGVVVLFASYGGALVGTALVSIALAVLFQPVGEAAEGLDFFGLAVGIAGGWFGGIALPVWFFRKHRSAIMAVRVVPGVDVLDAAIRTTRREGERTGRSRDPYDYTTYTYAELLDAAAHINSDAYPERASLLNTEIVKRRRMAHTSFEGLGAAEP